MSPLDLTLYQDVRQTLQKPWDAKGISGRRGQGVEEEDVASQKEWRAQMKIMIF